MDSHDFLPLVWSRTPELSARALENYQSRQTFLPRAEPHVGACSLPRPRPRPRRMSLHLRHFRDTNCLHAKRAACRTWHMFDVELRLHLRRKQLAKCPRHVVPPQLCNRRRFFLSPRVCLLRGQRPTAQTFLLQSRSLKVLFSHAEKFAGVTVEYVPKADLLRDSGYDQILPIFRLRIPQELG